MMFLMICKEKKMRLGKSTCIPFCSNLLEAIYIYLEGLLSKFLCLFFGDLIIYGTSSSGTRKNWRTDIGGRLNNSNGKRNHISVLNFPCKFVYHEIVKVLFKDIQIQMI